MVLPTVLVALFNRAKVRYLPVYVVLGVWVARLSSPACTPRSPGSRSPARTSEVRIISFRLRESIPVAEHLQNLQTHGPAT
jgi:hypothetical protein